MLKMIRSLVERIYNSVKSPLGLAVTGGIAGASATYSLERTKLSQDLVRALLDKEQLELRLLTLENESSDLVRQNRELLSNNVHYVDRCTTLMDELRHVSADNACAKESLMACQHTITFFEKSSRHSLALEKENAYNNPLGSVSDLERHPESTSIGKK